MSSTDAIDPGHSGLVLLVSDPAAVELQQALAKADHIVHKAVDKAAAEEIKAEAKAAQATADDRPSTDEEIEVLPIENSRSARVDEIETIAALDRAAVT